MNKTEPTQEEHQQTLQAFIYASISSMRAFVDYTQKYELYSTLTANEVNLMNQIAIAVQEYLDNEEIERNKPNGKLGQ